MVRFRRVRIAYAKISKAARYRAAYVCLTLNAGRVEGQND